MGSKDTKSIFLFSRESSEAGVVFFAPASVGELKEINPGEFVYPLHMPIGLVLEKAFAISSLPLLAILDSGTRPYLDHIKSATEKIKKTFGMIYGNHISRGKLLKSFQDPGDITGRFPYGPVRIYQADIIKKFLREIKRFNYNPEYALWLRLQEVPLSKIYVDETLGEHDDKWEHPNSQSFSYLLVPREKEREEERIFKDMLKRRGVFLEGPYMGFNFETRLTSPLVSVVIPVRNRVKTIEEAIISALNQTFKNFEVIVVDTGSRDGTKEKVKKIKKNSKKIRLVSLKGGEISHALNAGIKRARGAFIAQLDSDDLYLPETLEETVGVLIEHPKVALVVSYYRVSDESGNPIPGIPVIKHLEYDRNNLLRSEGIGAVRVWRKQALDILGGFDEKALSHFGEDYDMALKVSERWEVERIHKVLYIYRRHADSTDQQTGMEEKISLKTLARKRALRRRRRFNEMKRLAESIETQ